MARGLVPAFALHYVRLPLVCVRDAVGSDTWDRAALEGAYVDVGAQRGLPGMGQMIGQASLTVYCTTEYTVNGEFGSHGMCEHMVLCV